MTAQQLCGAAQRHGARSKMKEQTRGKAAWKIQAARRLGAEGTLTSLPNEHRPSSTRAVTAPSPCFAGAQPAPTTAAVSTRQFGGELSAPSHALPSVCSSSSVGHCWLTSPQRAGAVLGVAPRRWPRPCSVLRPAELRCGGRDRIFHGLQPASTGAGP